MKDNFRQMAIDSLRRGEDLPREWARELFPPEKRECELVYHDKDLEEVIIAQTMAVPLQPVSTFGKNGDGWANMLVFGDNLQVLRRLLEMKEQGKLTNADGTSGVRLVYIDPPFASKQEFQGTREQKAYQDKIVGTKFIEFVRSRLILIRRLLSSNGSVFIHLDQRKVHYLKVVLDELFGEQNFRNEIILPGRASKNLQQQFAEISRLNVRHDTLLWYSASPDTRFSPLWFEKHKSGNPEGHWHHFWSTADRPSMRYELFKHKPSTGQWTWEESRAKRAVKNYKRYEIEGGGRTLAEYWRDTGSTLEFIRKDPDDGKPQYWRAPAETRLADTLWAGVPIYSNSTGYPTEKNEALLNKLIELGSIEGDLVLDAFVGSGTTLAVAEKMGRRWIGIDCGKLAIYTVQKRMLNLTRNTGSKRVSIKPKPFTLYNGFLYDFSQLRKLSREEWRFFALQLFECKDEPHTIGGLQLDGKRKGAPVLVFDHHANPGKRIDEDTVRDLHAALGKKIGRKFYIIAPRGAFDFQQDYIDLDGIRYYALRIPYSVINELHSRDFSSLRQPIDELDVNDIVDAWGFDFIQAPQVEYSTSVRKRKGQKLGEACLKIKKFASRARLRGKDISGSFETFSMLMIDYDYNGGIFDMDTVYYAHELEADDWQAWFPVDKVGTQVMAVFLDIYGNEARESISRESFGKGVKNFSGKSLRKSQS